METTPTERSSASSATARGPLHGVRVVDFSTLLPGPMCSLLLARAGAEVIKVERPGQGDEMRSYDPKFGGDSVNFALLNQGKRSIALDLKRPSDLAQAIDLVLGADVLIEQFRPGVMARLGLGYEAMKARHPRLVYCSITGWGQHGPLAQLAAHDLNYQAETGLVALTTGADGAPGLPPVLAADIAGGAYPAVMNILLALRQRDAEGAGCHLDVAMAENLFALAYWGLGNGFADAAWPAPGAELVTGGTPRYQVYRTLDGRFLAVAPLEQRFWVNFLRVIGAPGLLDDAADPAGVRSAVATIIVQRSAQDWLASFDGVDACVSLVKSLEEGVATPHFAARGVFDRRLRGSDGRAMPALPLPISPIFERAELPGSPALGEAHLADFEAARVAARP